MARRIRLAGGRYFVVDDIDYEFLRQWRWHIVAGRYAGRRLSASEDESRPLTTVGHLLLGIKRGGGFVPDHRNGNPMDNRRGNLRVCTQHDNTRNKGRTKGRKYKGVYLRRGFSRPRWVAKINLPKQQILGTFDTQMEAALAYDRAARHHFGEFARLNFQ
jgi:hypothetical protein